MAFDGELCIALLVNKSTDEADRIGAAESLMFYPKKQACDALYQVVMDETDEEHIREEAAGSLGTLWIELGIDYERIVNIPDELLREVVADFRLENVVLDAERLGVHLERFRRLLSDMAVIP